MSKDKNVNTEEQLQEENVTNQTEETLQTSDEQDSTNKEGSTESAEGGRGYEFFVPLVSQGHHQLLSCHQEQCRIAQDIHQGFVQGWNERISKCHSCSNL